MGKLECPTPTMLRIYLEMTLLTLTLTFLHRLQLM